MDFIAVFVFFFVVSSMIARPQRKNHRLRDDVIHLRGAPRTHHDARGRSRRGYHG